MMPAMNSFHERFNTHDAGPYDTPNPRQRWHHEYEHVNPEGSAVVFPPGYFHETILEGGEWSTSVTAQFQRPQPVKYIRNFFPRLVESALGYEEKCYKRWETYVTFGREAKPTLDANIMRKRVTNIFDTADMDSNEMLEAWELRRLFEREKWASTPEFGWVWARLDQQKMQLMHAELIDFRVNDTVAYHDLDGDGKISVAEFWESTVQWNIVLHKTQKVNKLLRKSRVSMEPRGKKFKGRTEIVAVEEEYDRLYRKPRFEL